VKESLVTHHLSPITTSKLYAVLAGDIRYAESASYREWQSPEYPRY
jgi:hypothetical protein